MKNLWKFSKQGVLSVGISLLVVGCGNTGPDADSNNTGGNSNASIGSGVGTNTSQQSSSVSSEGNNNSDFVVTLASRELTEGSHKSQFLSGGEPMVWPADNDWPDSEEIVGEYEPTLIPLEFSLDNPFSTNITATVEFDAENSDCAKPLPLSKKGVVSINSGVTNFAIDAALFPDNYPEDDCNARFKIIFDDGVNKKTIVAKGAIRVLDDDKGVGDVVTTDQLYPGQYFDWPLNGARRYDGSDIVVTQIKGPTAEFKIDKHQLKLIVPSAESGSIADRTVILSVQPAKSAAYTISFLIRAGLMEPLSVEDTTAGDSDYDADYVNFYKDAKVYGYHTGYIPSKTLTDLKWVIETDSPENRIVLDKNSTRLAYRGGGFEVATADEDAIANLLQLLPDNRTVVLNPAYIPILQKYLDDGRVPYIQWEVKIFQNNVISEDDEIEGQYFNHQKIEFTSWIRPAPRKATVTILGLDAKQISQSNLRMAIVQQSNPDQITQYKSVENVKTEFDFLVQGSYSVSVVDFDKGEIANGIFTLDDKTTEVDYQLELRELPSSLENASAKKTNATEGVNQKKVATSVSKASEECKDDRGEGYYVASANQDLEISCTKTFSADELMGDEDGVSRQLVIQVESLEYPSFLLRKEDDKALAKFKDTWSWAVDTKIDALKSMTKSAAGEIQSSHKTARSVFSVSPCFTLLKDSKEEIKFTAKAKNVGDSQVSTYVSAKITDCEELYVVAFAKLQNHEASKKKYLFAHATPGLNGGYAYVSLPYKLTANDGRYKAANNAFGFELDIKPLKGDSAIAKAMQIHSIDMYLQHYRNGVETLLELGNIDPKLTSPKVTISDITKKIGPDVVFEGKKVKITDYRLPLVDSEGTEILYPADNGFVHLMLKVNINKNADDEGTTKIAALHLKDNEVTSEVNIDSPHLRVLMDMDALKIAIPQHTNRFDWNPVGNTRRYGGLVPDATDWPKGGDRWMAPIVWKRIFASESYEVTCPSSSSSSSSSSANSISSGSSLSSSSSVHPLCLPAVGDNLTAPTFFDYLDELSLNDVTAIHNRIYWKTSTSKWRSVIEHGGHHNGLELDLSYVEPDGTVTLNGLAQVYPKRVNTLWNNVVLAAGDDSKQKQALEELINWIKVNRATMDSIIDDAKSRGLKVTILYLGTKTGMGAGVPSIYDILTKGKLPTHSLADIEKLGSWRDDKKIVKPQDPHEHHFHVSFEHFASDEILDD